MENFFLICWSSKWLYCSETTLTGESRFHISPPRGFEPGSLVTGSKQVVHWTSETWWERSEIAGSPQGSPPAADSVVVKPEGRPAESMKPGQESSVRSSGIITLSARGPSDCFWDEARLRRGHDDQSRQGHQCSETILTGESRFHISPPRGFEPGSLVTGSKQVVHWTSETWWEWSEIAGSPQYHD